MYFHYLNILYLNEKELIQQVCIRKYKKNEISNSTSHRKKQTRGETSSITQKRNPAYKNQHFQNSWESVISYTSC